MKKLDQYSDYPTFLKDLENSPNDQLPFKIFGPKKKKTGDYHSFSCLGQVYSQIENPDQSPNKLYKAPFGEIYRYGCRLSPHVYSSITPNSKGINQFQSDIFMLEDPLNFEVQSSLVMLASHSCELENQKIVSVFPVYKESDLISDGSKVATIRGTPPKDHKAVVSNWLTNESKIILGLPPQNFEGRSERFAIHLRDIKTINRNILPNDPVLRLSFIGLSYFQIRIFHFYFRDVQDSDEFRDL